MDKTFEFIIKWLFVALSIVSAILILIRVFKAPKNQDINQNSLVKETFSPIKTLIFCFSIVIIYKAITMLIMYFVLNCDPFLMSSWERSTDIPHYIDIAKDGYVSDGTNAKWIVFFPLYPYILRVVGGLFNEYFNVGSVLSMIFFAVGLYYLYKVTFLEYGKKVARKTIKYVVIFPASFFALLPMTEGLFIMLIAMFLYFMYMKKYFAACIVGFLAAFTRSAGVFLVAPFVAALYEDFFSSGFNKENFKAFFKKVPLVFIIPMATLIYLYINYSLFGDPLMFTYYQTYYWNQGLGFYGNTIATLFNYAVNVKNVLSYSLFIPELVISYFAIILCVMQGKRKLIYQTLSLSQVLYSLSAVWLLSAPRYMMPILPLSQTLALYSSNKLKDFLITVLVLSMSAYLFYIYLTSSYVY